MKLVIKDVNYGDHKKKRLLKNEQRRLGAQESTVDEVNKWKEYGGFEKFVNVACRGAEILHFGRAVALRGHLGVDEKIF